MENISYQSRMPPSVVSQCRERIRPASRGWIPVRREEKKEEEEEEEEEQEKGVLEG